MKATITYRVEWHPHPWDAKQRARGVNAWCLVMVTTPEVGPKTVEPVAIFNFDSEAERFMGHVFASGLDGQLVSIDPNQKELFELLGRRQPTHPIGTPEGGQRT